MCMRIRQERRWLYSLHTYRQHEGICTFILLCDSCNAFISAFSHYGNELSKSAGEAKEYCEMLLFRYPASTTQQPLIPSQQMYK